MGFRGGALDPNSYTAGGPPSSIRVLGSFDNLEGSEKGEGIGGFYTEYDALFSRYGIGAPANGGGGGGYQNSGGGGGANCVVGGAYTGRGNPIGFAAVWNLEAAGFGGSTSAGGGRGGYAISDIDQNELVVGPANAAWGGDDRKNTGGFGGHPLPFFADRVYFGGGGGAGDQDSGEGGAGGRGGGIVFVQAYGTVTGNGLLKLKVKQDKTRTQQTLPQQVVSLDVELMALEVVEVVDTSTLKTCLRFQHLSQLM
jgi:hypothetical protein